MAQTGGTYVDIIRELKVTVSANQVINMTD